MDELYNLGSVALSTHSIAIENALHIYGQMYFSFLDSKNSAMAALNNIAAMRLPSLGGIGTQLNLRPLYGLPWHWDYKGLYIDVGRNVQTYTDKSANQPNALAYGFRSGMAGSLMESTIWEMAHNLPGISAVKAIGLAADLGIPIFAISLANKATILPLLQIGANEINEIEDYINAGNIVLVPQEKIDYYAWRGIGYIAFNPRNMSGSYIISGGIRGGSFVGDVIECVGEVSQMLDIISFLIPGMEKRIALELYSGISAIGDIMHSEHLTKEEKIMSSFNALMLTIAPIAADIADAPLSVDIVLAMLEAWFYFVESSATNGHPSSEDWLETYYNNCFDLAKWEWK